MDRSRFGRSTLGNVSVDIMALNKASSRNQKILADVYQDLRRHFEKACVGCPYGWFLGRVTIHSTLQRQKQRPDFAGTWRLFFLPQCSCRSFSPARYGARCLWIRTNVSEPQNMGALSAAILPALAAGLAIERGFQFPDWRIGRMLERA